MTFALFNSPLFNASPSPARSPRRFSSWSCRRRSSGERGRTIATTASPESTNPSDPRGVSISRLRPSEPLDEDEKAQIWSRASAAAIPAVDLDAVTNVTLTHWGLRLGGLQSRRHGGFRVFSRDVLTPNAPGLTEVLATGELQCSLAEVAAILRAPNAGAFNDMMATLYGRSFQRGAFVYDFQDPKDEALEAPTGLDFLPRYQCVKTACFTAPRLALFARDERWCFLEQFEPIAKRPDSERCGFTLSQRSVRAEALPRAAQPPINLSRRRGFASRSSQSEAQQLTGLSLSYLVEIIPERQPTAVRVTFFGCAHEDPHGGSSHRVAQRRLLALARGVLKLPEIVRRRRMSAQVPANRWSTAQRRSANPGTPATSRCVGCTRQLHILLMVKKTRCYLCAHFVCSRCWLRQSLETANGRKATVLVCPHCLDSVNHCSYENLAASYLSSQDGGGSSLLTSSGASRGSGSAGCFLRLAQVLPDPEDAREPGHAVVSCLEEVLREQTNAEGDADSGSEAEANTRTQAAMHVLRLLVSVLADGANRSEGPGLDTPSLQTLQTQLADQVLPLEACVLSNDVTRSYPIDTSGGSNADAVPVGPVPPNESHRLDAIKKDQLLAAGGSEELTLICELATRELNCMASLVTIVGTAHQFVLATDLAPLRGAELPREHTFCQHLLMGDRPMLVQHPEADVRFRNLNPVVHNGVQFYGGFPVFSRDGLSVVGSLCCLDIRPREMTRSQYSTLTQLTRTASKVIELKGSQACALQRR